jgi:putative phosphoribosyl transferase
MFFDDRPSAGKLLAERLLSLKLALKNPIVLGIPRGGIPIGDCIAKALNAPLDVLVLRKLPIPDNPEAGFGAVTLDKIPIFNELLLPQLGLTGPQINKIIDNVHKEVIRRNKLYRKDRPLPILKGRSVILTDDGLATGFTMLAAVRFAKGEKAGEVIVAAPVAHQEAYRIIEREADKTVVLHISRDPYFAVASFYREFTDMEDSEVIAYLEK